MKREILVDILLPAAETAIEVWLPCGEPLHELLQLIKRAAKELAGGRFTPGADTALYDLETGTVFDTDGTPEQLGLGNGSQLFLI